MKRTELKKLIEDVISEEIEKYEVSEDLLTE